MIFGMRGHDFGCYTPSRLLELYKEHGVEGVQLAIPKAIEGVASYHDVSGELLQTLKQEFEKAGVALPVLGCYIEPSLTDEAERAAQLATFKAGIRCAAALGAGVIGTETTTYRGDEAGRDKQLTALYKSVEELLRCAEDAGVTMAVEPVFWHTMNSPEQTRRLLDTFKSESLKVIFDPVNLLTEQVAKNQAAMWKECIDAFGPYVRAMHIKDLNIVNGEQVACKLGDGIVDYGAIVTWLQKEHPDMALLREETDLARVDEELAWMRATFLA